MKKRSVNVCIYGREFFQNVESIITSTGIVMKKIREGFDEFHDEFKPFLESVREGNIEYFVKSYKARNEGVEIENIELNEIERFTSDPSKDKGIKDMLKDMKNILNLIKDVNSERMIEFLHRNKVIYFFTEFEKYLFKCIKFILLKYPEILDEKSIQLKEIRIVQNNGNFGLIKEIIAENTIHDLFYKNYNEIFKYFKKPLGLEIEISQKVINKLNGYREIRNLLTHGDGIINLLFQNRIINRNLSIEDLNLNSLEIGEKLTINQNLIADLLHTLSIIVIELDVKMMKKFPELRFEMESFNHLFYQTYITYLIEKWTKISDEV